MSLAFVAGNFFFTLKLCLSIVFTLSLLSSERVPKCVKKDGSSCLCVAGETCASVDNTEIAKL